MSTHLDTTFFKSKSYINNSVLNLLVLGVLDILDKFYVVCPVSHPATLSSFLLVPLTALHTNSIFLTLCLPLLLFLFPVASRICCDYSLGNEIGDVPTYVLSESCFFSFLDLSSDDLKLSRFCLSILFF